LRRLLGKVGEKAFTTFTTIFIIQTNRMEANYLASAGVGSSTIAVLFVAYKLFKKLEGHKLVSNCCGKKTEVGFAVEEMSPSHSEERRNPPVEASAVGVSKETLSVRLPALPESPEGQGT
jgi:hypothetical protein